MDIAEDVKDREGVRDAGLRYRARRSAGVQP
jgi:hypothetical protein